MTQNFTEEQIKLMLSEYLQTIGIDANVVSKSDDNFDWHDLLEKSSRGQIKPTYENHKIVFENALNGELKYNEFERVIEYNGKRIDNASVAILRNAFEREGKFRNRDVMRDFMLQYSQEHKYNPIKDYLEKLEWDGVQRVATLFIDWLKVEDNIVNRKLTEKWLVSGIKRIYEPGCLIEGMIVLVGAQGVGKSTIIKKLGKNKYAVEAIVDLRNEKNCVETFNRAWIVNFDELKSIIKADSDLAKAVLTRQSDTSRLAYREESESYERHCIFIGATNDTSILKDYSDKVERRYWMLQCNQSDKRYIYENFTDDIVDQIWAEAYHIYCTTPNYNISISDFTDEENEIMYETQRAFKSFNGDDLADDLIEMLDNKYSLNANGAFASKDDFANQATGKSNGINNNICKQIDAIPLSYINYYLQLTKNGRPVKYVIEALADNWRVVEKHNYDGHRLRCFVRRTGNIITNSNDSMCM